MSARQILIIAIVLILSVAAVPAIRLIGLELNGFTLAIFMAALLGGILLAIRK